MPRLRGQVAVITGASSGIGTALARNLAKAGVRVGLTARRTEALESLAGSIQAWGGTAVVAPADATDRVSTHAAIERVASELGPIDLLIANAGMGLSTPADHFSADDVEQLVRVNILGVAYAVEAVLPPMLARGRGHIVGISSLAAYRGLPGTGGYCATKAALSALLESLRVELRPKGIAVTTVHPGYVRTPMTERANHRMPFLMDVEHAARIISRGIAARRSEVNFPWPIAGFMALVRLLPNSIYDRLSHALIGRRQTPPAGS
jgi:short-subunit dehydrogenase